MSQTGIIYEIVCNQTGERYIGSTMKNLKNRILGHKNKCNRCMSKPIIDRGDFVCNILETTMVNTKNELRIIERNYFENLDCVNKRKPYICNTPTLPDSLIITTDRKKYMREYQKQRYRENAEKYSLLRKNAICKSLNQVSPEEELELGDRLAEYKMVETLAKKLSPELQNKLFQSLDLNAI